MKIFLTGATGFLGYHIAKRCAKLGYPLLCLKRKTSVSQFSTEIEEKLQWVVKDDSFWKETVRKFQPDVLIHSAWEGISADMREDEIVQYRNLEMFLELMNLYPYHQIIGLGSQEEYGYLDSVIKEEDLLRPQTAYGKNKILCSEHLKLFSDIRKCEWQWIRVFSVYGEKQRATWLIPTFIKKCIQSEKSIATTKAEQQYAYLYCDDFAKAIVSVIGTKGKSGIYNLSSSQLVTLKHLLLTIKKLLYSNIYIDFGVRAYRLHQSMLIAGDSSKFINAFGKFEETSLETGLYKTIISIKNETI